MKKLVPKELLFLYEKIKKVIGIDPYISVERLHRKNETWYIDLICDKYDKAVGLCCIIKDKFKICNSYGVIRIFFKNKETVVKCEGDSNRINHSRLALMLIQLGLKSNPYFYRARLITDKEYGWFEKIIVEFKPAVVQIYNGDNKDFYGNINIVAKDIFEEILKDTVLKDTEVIYTNKSIS